MAKIIVAGLINIETTIKIDHFPIDYTPVRFAFGGVRSTVSGVGYNITKALTTLGHDVDFLSLIADDPAGSMIHAELRAIGVNPQHVVSSLAETPQSAILYDDAGKRMINSDLKAIQETFYPLEQLNVEGVDIAVLANINFSRPMLAKVKAAGIPIATDIHTISTLDDDYNRDYMAHADILFMSDEHLPTTPEVWVHQVWQRYETPIIGIGLGAEGALIAVREDNRIEQMPAKALRPIISTIGSGDALFSAFVHGYITTKDPYHAMRQAVLFSGYKIGAAGGGEGFLTAAALAQYYHENK